MQQWSTMNILREMLCMFFLQPLTNLDVYTGQGGQFSEILWAIFTVIRMQKENIPIIFFKVSKQ